MKKIKLLFLLVLAASCAKDFLDRKPLGSATEEDLPSLKGSVDAQVFGLYAFPLITKDLYSQGKLTGEGIADLPMVLVTSIRSDDAVKGYVEANTAAYEAIADRYQYDKGDTWLLPLFWNNHYQLIFNCNNVLSYIASQTPTSANQMNAGEAKFFRGWCYFQLVRCFGQVPKIDFVVKEIGDANVAKSSVETIYQFIIEDLTFAAAHLPATWSGYPGRLTSGAAHALLAKVYLHYNRDWGTALQHCEAVINSGRYALYPNYAELFTEKGNNSAESIFDIQNYSNASGSYYAYTRLAEQTAIRGGGNFNQGWGWNQPSQALVDAYEQGDPRKDATILQRGKSDGYGTTLPNDLQLPYWNKKEYDKYDNIISRGLRFPSYLHTRLLRYADVLLMAAEAANELGQTQKALQYVNQIRQRARGSANVLPDITTTQQQALRDAIKHERRVEMGMEYERFYDLVRWGDAETVLSPLGYLPKCKYMPIPQSVIDRAQGVITQNPDWQ